MHRKNLTDKVQLADKPEIGKARRTDGGHIAFDDWHLQECSSTENRAVSFTRPLSSLKIE